MAGIAASASSATHADSGADVSTSGFITGEQIGLQVNPTGTNYQWALTIPSSSNASRSRLSGDDESVAHFTPDAAGIYVVSVVVDSSTYFLRIAVTQLAQSTALESLRLSPVQDSQVAEPSTGLAVYCSSTQSGALAVKNADGDIFTITLTPV